jgi:hypothetical protein
MWGEHGVKVLRASPDLANPVTANAYFRMAAEESHAAAALMFALSLLRVGPVAEAMPEVMRYLRMSADGGNRNAQYLHAVQLRNGDGCELDLGLANGYLPPLRRPGPCGGAVHARRHSDSGPGRGRGRIGRG